MKKIKITDALEIISVYETDVQSKVSFEFDKNNGTIVIDSNKNCFDIVYENTNKRIAERFQIMEPKEQVKKDFLVNRDETGREIVYYPETGKKYYVEYIEPRNWRGADWGDVDPATKKVTGSYGDKYKGAISANESVITKENGFENIVEGEGSPYDTIHKMHEQWKKENGF